MTTAHRGDPADINVKRVLDTAIGNREMSVNELILKSGLKKSTYFRRRVEGGWKASELLALARALECGPDLFFRDADELLPRWKDGSPVNKSSLWTPFHGESLALTA